MEREFWLKRAHLAPRPIVFASKVLPRSLVHHLLTQKSRSAVKRKENHKISCLEGACHSLVVPVVFPTYMNAVTNYRGQHVIDPLPADEPPFVVISALVQPDFEFKNVMYEMIRLTPNSIEGQALPETATEYTDLSLKSNMIYHFTESRCLPAESELSKINATDEKYIRINNDTLSVELLRNLVREQIRVEMAALTAIAESFDIKLVYTWDPPMIFARCFPFEVLNKLWVDAVTTPGLLSPSISCIAYNDFANKQTIDDLRSRLPNCVAVCRKGEHQLRPGQFKVLHTNGDAFAQHILTQPAHSSLEGAIGACSNAAASICLQRPKNVVYV